MELVTPQGDVKPAVLSDKCNAKEYNKSEAKKSYTQVLLSSGSSTGKSLAKKTTRRLSLGAINSVYR